MSKKEPEITKIASYIANQIPTDGVPTGEAVDAWRNALRYARATGSIEELAEKVAMSNPEDAELQAVCADVAH